MARLAIKTLAAIEDMLVKDQGAKFRNILAATMPLAGDAYNPNEESFRTHLGASLIGRECPREVWYSFHWTIRPAFSGRMIRLFNRGHLEEPRFVALLLAIGCQVWQLDENGKQFRVTGHMGHFGGSLDAAIRGCPDIPDEPILGEFKTHGEKSFLKLLAEGMREAKWEHYVQMQTYMGKNSFQYGLYMAVNKNTDEIYAEIIEFDSLTYFRYQDRSAMIIEARTAPKRISESPGWFKCKFCDAKPVCHGDVLPDRNCRTCTWSQPVEDGQWICKNAVIQVKAEQQGWEDPIELDKAAQLKACEEYELDPTFKAK